MAPSAVKQQERPEERPSFIFNGAVNTMGQGGPVNLVYGRFLTGSAVVSAGTNAEQLQTYTSPTNGNQLCTKQRVYTLRITIKMNDKELQIIGSGGKRR